MTARPPNTRAARTQNKRMLAADNTCHLCGHPDADAIDHVIPLARGGKDHISNKAPAHHLNPCPTCGIKCNRVKADKLIAPVIRRSGALTRPGGRPPTAPQGHSSA